MYMYNYAEFAHNNVRVSVFFVKTMQWGTLANNYIYMYMFILYMYNYILYSQLLLNNQLELLIMYSLLVNVFWVDDGSASCANVLDNRRGVWSIIIIMIIANYFISSSVCCSLPHKLFQACWDPIVLIIKSVWLIKI